MPIQEKKKTKKRHIHLHSGWQQNWEVEKQGPFPAVEQP